MLESSTASLGSLTILTALNPIRPNQLPVATPRPVRPETHAAQRAFFEAAVARAAAPASAKAEPVRAAAPAARAIPEPEPEARRFLRPGSLLDIKV